MDIQLNSRRGWIIFHCHSRKSFPERPQLDTCTYGPNEVPTPSTIVPHPCRLRQYNFVFGLQLRMKWPVKCWGQPVISHHGTQPYVFISHNGGRVATAKLVFLRLPCELNLHGAQLGAVAARPAWVKQHMEAAPLGCMISISWTSGLAVALIKRECVKINVALDFTSTPAASLTLACLASPSLCGCPSHAGAKESGWVGVARNHESPNLVSGES